jgi:hypothetical protein
MPRIVALRPGSVAGADLGHVTFRLGLGVSRWADHWCFSLMFFYPPTTTALFRPVDSLFYTLPPAFVALVQAPISLATSEEELSRVTSVAAGNGSADIDLQRMNEAFEMFKNRDGRVDQNMLDACKRDAHEVVKVFDRVRQWVAAGMTKPETQVVVTSYAQKEGQSMETTLVCTP